MSEVHFISQTLPKTEYRANGQSAERAERPETSEVESDRFELSSLAARLGDTNISDLRLRKIADVRAAIESGTYVTSEKLNATINRLFDEFLAG